MSSQTPVRSGLATVLADHQPAWDGGCGCGWRVSLGARVSGFSEVEWAEHVADELTALLDTHLALAVESS
jgi:hypothetical protein